MDRGEDKCAARTYRSAGSLSGQLGVWCVVRNTLQGLITAMLALAFWPGCSEGPPETDAEADTNTDADADADADAEEDGGGDADAEEDGGGDADADADGASDAEVDGGEVEYDYRCEWIGSGYSDGFFSLASFDGHLYAGQFGYGHEAESMLYRYPDWELVAPGLTGIGESICAMEEHEGWLYANTEHSGDIFRSADGTIWEQVYNGDSGSIGCGLAVFEGRLFAVNYGFAAEAHGRVLRQDAEGWTIVYDSGSDPLYLREIVAYDGALYAFGVQDDRGRLLTSTDGESWTMTDVGNRYFRGHVWNGYLWLGSTNNRAPGEVGVYRFDGETFELMESVSERYVTEIEDLDGRLYAGTSRGFKEERGPCRLLLSEDSGASWRGICSFTETAIWSLAILDGAVYLGTWDFGVGGSVYRVVREEVEPTVPVDCTLISAANPAWEVCETEDQFCAGVFTDGAGCGAYCAQVGLPCSASFGGGEGCVQEPESPLSCGPTDHESDWCECGFRD